MGSQSSTGKKGAKKIGRWGHKPANQRYKLQGRRDINKARKIAKNAKREAKDKIKRERREEDAS